MPAPNISDKKLHFIAALVSTYGKEKAAELLSVKPNTLARRIREAKERGIYTEKSRYLDKISEQYSEKELQAISAGGRVAPGQPKVPIVSFEGERIRIGALTDTHLGSIYTNPDYVYQAFEEFKEAGVDFITHSGDVVDGMSNRKDHIYFLSHLGYSKQKEHAVEVFSQCPAKLYMIDGNHDRWFVKSAGAYIVKDICDEIGAVYLGQDEGDISLKGKATLKLWHGEDGNSYALSYRLQKIIESFSGGEKPALLLAGHTHKSLYIFERFVHTYSIGTMQAQTKWMHGKRIAAHLGFWILDIWVGKSGITKTTGTWYPFYA